MGEPISADPATSREMKSREGNIVSWQPLQKGLHNGVAGPFWSHLMTDPTPRSATPAGGPPLLVPLPANAALQPGPAREFLAWADTHQRDRRRHAAVLAQITRHHDLNPSGDAVHQQQAWALRQAHAQHLHDSAMAQQRQPV